MADKIAEALTGTNYILQAITTEPFFDDEIEAEISEFKPNLIILDLLLVEDKESGFRVLRKIKESDSLREVPVMVCSKYVDDTETGKELCRKAMDRGAHIAVDKNRLDSVLSEWISKNMKAI